VAFGVKHFGCTGEVGHGCGGAGRWGKKGWASMGEELISIFEWIWNCFKALEFDSRRL
jgi:hypothetical protein